MKNIALVLALTLAAVCAGMGITGAAEKATIEKGKALFNDPRLGTTGSSCNTCHINGRGLEAAATKKQWIRAGKAYKTMEALVNGCIIVGLHGKALDVKSIEMQSLVLYIKSLAKKKETAPKKPPVGC